MIPSNDKTTLKSCASPNGPEIIKRMPLGLKITASHFNPEGSKSLMPKNCLFRNKIANMNPTIALVIIQKTKYHAQKS